MEIPRDQLKVAVVLASPRIQNHDRSRVEVGAFPEIVHEVRRGIAAWHVQQPTFRIQGKARPGAATADRKLRIILPAVDRCRPRSRRRWPVRGITGLLRYQVELPEDASGRSFERIHSSL